MEKRRIFIPIKYFIFTFSLPIRSPLCYTFGRQIHIAEDNTMAIRFENGRYQIDENYIIRRQTHLHGAPAHTHDFIELVYQLNGHCLHVIDGKSYQVSRGDMAFINYRSVHEIPPTGNADYVNILIKPEYIHQSLLGSENAFSILALKDFADFSETAQKSHLMMHFSGGERVQLEGLIERMTDELSHPAAGSELVIRSCINILLTMVFRRMDLPMKDHTPLTHELLAYINANCAHSLSLEEVAKRAGYNSAYFSRLFKIQTGQTFTDYLTHCRIRLAANLLAESDAKVEEIISEAGFTNRTRFFKLFSAQMGTTPHQYRKRIQNKLST